MSTETQQLLDLEAIKTLKARYFRCMDSKDWDGLESPGKCFTEDLHADFRGWGHYLEHYRKQNGEWRIRSIRLTRLRLLLNGEEQDID